MMGLFSNIISFVFPPRCPCCNEINHNGLPCDECAVELKKCENLKNACRYCGLDKSCCQCSKYHYLFEGVASPFKNKGVAQEGVYGMKYHSMFHAARYFGVKLAECFAERFKNVNIDFVCIVPTHKSRLRKISYDYVELLAKTVAHKLGLPFRPKTLKKIKVTESQHLLPIDKRQANVKGAFLCKDDLHGKTILLIDDIKTTGYTLNECSKQLRMCGAEKVYCATALITEHKKSLKEKNIESMITF